MADEPKNDQGGNNNSGEGGQNQNGNEQQNQFKPVTFNTQEDFDKAFADRATRAAETAKNEAMKPLLEAGISLEDALAAFNEKKAAEDAKKDPATKEREAHEATQAKLRAYEAKEQREKLAKDVAKELKIGETPLPPELLHGSTKEEMEANGKAILEFINVLAGKPGVRAPGHNPDQGGSSNDRQKAADPIRQLFETGSFL